MAYNLYITESDITYKILNSYKKKIFTLKQDTPCKNGNFIIGSIIAVISAERINRPDNKLFVNLEILDIKENIQDVLTIFAESNDDLANILENLFVIDKTKTEYYEQYNMLHKQVDNTGSVEEFENILLKIALPAALIAILALLVPSATAISFDDIIGSILFFISFITIMLTAQIADAIIEIKQDALIKKADIVYAKILATND